MKNPSKDKNILELVIGGGILILIVVSVFLAGLFTWKEWRKEWHPKQSSSQTPAKPAVPPPPVDNPSSPNSAAEVDGVPAAQAAPTGPSLPAGTVDSASLPQSKAAPTDGNGPAYGDLAGAAAGMAGALAAGLALVYMSREMRFLRTASAQQEDAWDKLARIQTEQAKSQTEQAKSQAEQAKSQAEQAKLQAQQSRILAEQAQLQADLAIIDAATRRIANAKSIIHTLWRDEEVPLVDQAFAAEKEKVFAALGESIRSRLPEGLWDEAMEQLGAWKEAARDFDAALKRLQDRAARDRGDAQEKGTESAVLPATTEP